MNAELRVRIEQFVSEYNEIYREMYAEHYKNSEVERVTFDEPGAANKFLVLWQGSRDGRSKSAICFIALVDGESKAVGPYKAGDILKPATYKAPAKGVRGSILNEDMFKGGGNFRQNKTTPSWYR